MLPRGLLEMSGDVLFITVTRQPYWCFMGRGWGTSQKTQESFHTGKNILSEIPVSPLRTTELFDENILFLCHLC